jgi:hypothetical protein
MCEKYINVPIFKEAYDAFQQGKDTYSIETKRGNVENHYIKQVISVHRFLSEINVIKQKERDKNKVQAAQNKNWNILYVLPGNKSSVNDVDIKTVKELVGDNYFFWKRDSDKLLNYLSSRYNIVKQIKDMINEMLYSWVIEKLIPLLTLFTLRLLMEQIEMYRKLIMDMITACSFKIERKGNLLDVVEYVDIDPKLEELKQTALSKTNC